MRNLTLLSVTVLAALIGARGEAPAQIRLADCTKDVYSYDSVEAVGIIDGEAVFCDTTVTVTTISCDNGFRTSWEESSGCGFVVV